MRLTEHSALDWLKLKMLRDLPARKPGFFRYPKIIQVYKPKHAARR